MARTRAPGGRHVWLWAISAVALALRLIELGGPLIDGQAWRQADTAAMARNFHEEGGSICYPRVDWRGTTPGYVETNFPLYPFLVARLYDLAGGVHEWLGRLLSALLATAAGALLYVLAWRIYRQRLLAGLAALLFALLPLSLYFGRAFMPEPLMLLLSIAAVLSFDLWLERGGAGLFAAAWACAALCFAVKIPTLYLGSPLLAVLWSRAGWPGLRRPSVWAYGLLVLVPAAVWYWHAHSLFQETGLTFGIWQSSGYDKWAHGLLLDLDFYRLMAARFALQVFTPVGGLLVAAGLYWRYRENRQEAVLYAWMAGLVLYVLLVPEGNRKLHYYQLPFTVPAAVLTAKAMAVLWGSAPWPQGRERPHWLGALPTRWRRGLVAAALLAVAGASAWAAGPYFRPPNGIYEYYKSSLEAGRILDQRLPKDALVVVGDLDENAVSPHRAQSPTMLYYSHRKGWQITPSQCRPQVLDSLAALGASHFVVAGGLIAGNRELWRHLFTRGITVPSAYPRVWRDTGEFGRAHESFSGEDRHFVVVSIGASD